MWFAKPYYLKLQHEKHLYHILGDGLESGTAAVAVTEASVRAEASNRNVVDLVAEEEEDDEEEVYI